MTAPIRAALERLVKAMKGPHVFADMDDEVAHHNEQYAALSAAEAALALPEQPPVNVPDGEMVTERYWCGCVRESRWVPRCARHVGLEHDEEPPSQTPLPERVCRWTWVPSYWVSGCNEGNEYANGTNDLGGFCPGCGARIEEAK